MKYRYKLLFVICVLIVSFFTLFKIIIEYNYLREKVQLLCEILNDVDSEEVVSAASINSNKVEDEEVSALLSSNPKRVPKSVYTKGSLVIFIYDSGDPKIVVERLEFHSK